MDVTHHAAGRFCWVELATTDAAGAKQFYGALLGWECEDAPAGPGVVYTMCRIDGKRVAAIHTHVAGNLPHWLSYVATDDADATQTKTEAAGGRVVMKAFDVMDAGRMTVLQDPNGATFGVWQAKNHTGAERVRDAGALAWNELMTRDAPACTAFYASVFGWTPNAMEMPGFGTYTVFETDEESVAGMMTIPEQAGPLPPHWAAYFAVASCDAAIAKAQTLGAKVLVPAMDVEGVGRFATLTDPQGAAFSILQSAR
jgi:uncharacterized protein